MKDWDYKDLLILLLFNINRIKRYLQELILLLLILKYKIDTAILTNKYQLLMIRLSLLTQQLVKLRIISHLYKQHRLNKQLIFHLYKQIYNPKERSSEQLQVNKQLISNLCKQQLVL